MSFRAVLAKDLLRERRGKEAFQAGIVVVLLFSVTFLFAYATLQGAPRAAALILWLPILYAGISASGRSFALEADAGVLPLLRASPVPLGLHGIVRTLVQVVVGLVLALVSAIIASLAWDISLDARVLLPLMLGALGIAIIGTLTGGLAAQARARDILVPVLAVPLLVPLLQAALPATIMALEGAAWSAMQAPLLLLIGFDAIALGVAWMLWPFVMEGD